ncbi:MAG: amidohydrolase [Gammaproteobacteria bacterium]|nr:amidohydrolase [Gammaproteobacteria bacterium]
MNSSNPAYCTAPLADELVAWRHDFHAHPELGFAEHRTATRIAELLESFGVTVYREVGQTGVVGVLQKGNSTRSIGLRADIDALPIEEAGELPYRSRTSATMHACGHDGHTAMLLGAACYLAKSGHFSGRVVFIFQPNEEHGLGARAMIDDGLFERFDVDEVYGMHNMPGMPVGTFATRSGPITASESLFDIEINASGGHAALPHMGVDAIVVGAQIVGALQTIVSRKLNPGLNGVVSVTEFLTDGKRNVLPGWAKLCGDARALTPEINATVEQRMREIVAGVCAAHSVTAVVSYDTIFPATINSPQAVSAAVESAVSVVGSDAVNGQCESKLFSEDFAHMCQEKPGCYMLMGNGTAGGNARPLHSADYDFNDDALVPGSSYWVALAEQQLAG